MEICWSEEEEEEGGGVGGVQVFLIFQFHLNSNTGNNVHQVNMGADCDSIHNLKIVY